MLVTWEERRSVTVTSGPVTGGVAVPKGRALVSSCFLECHSPVAPWRRHSRVWWFLWHLHRVYVCYVIYVTS